MEPIEIVCGIDTNYVPHLAVMLTSLTASNPGQIFRVHVLHDGISKVQRNRVNQCCPKVQIEWKEIEEHPVLGFEGILHISRATYLRLAMVDALDPVIRRVLYLDVDLIINGDVRSLWDTDLGNKVCAAVIDPGMEAKTFAKKHSLPLSGSYFNAGVMLIDMERMRAEPFLERAVAILANPDSRCEFADQDALNIVLWNQWLPVNLTWNFQRKFLYNDFSAWKTETPLTREPAIIHFTEGYKPWRGTEWHPYAWLYSKYLLRTPFRNEVMRAGKIRLPHICKSWLRYRLKRKSVYA